MAAGAPNEDGWRMPIERADAIVRFLLERQPLLREEMVSWMPRLS